MKFNCGPTKEAKKQSRRQARLVWAKSVMQHGEVVFAWLPKRVGPDNCRWLEKVRRFPKEVYVYDLWAGGYWTDHNRYVSAVDYIAFNSIRWKYEAIE